MADTVKEMVVKLGIDVDHEGLAKARESLAPLVDLVSNLRALKALGIRVQITMDGADTRLGADGEP